MASKFIDPEKCDCPWTLLHNWRDQTLDEPGSKAFYLATASNNHPSVRAVLYRSDAVDDLRFFTNYHSRKANEITANARVAGVLYFPATDRQIRIEGKARKTSRDVSAKYFSDRPRQSQLASWASEQSKAMVDRQVLMDHFENVKTRFAGQDVPCPEHWGGFAIEVDTFEFFIGRKHRLHDRFCFRRRREGWERHRLQP